MDGNDEILYATLDTGVMRTTLTRIVNFLQTH